MAATKKTFLIVNNTGDNVSDVILGDSLDSEEPNFVDLDLDGNGNIRMIEKEEAIIQTVLKCLFTEVQDNGYGSNIYDFIGEKELSAKKVALFMGLMMSIVNLKGFMDTEIVRQSLTKNDLIASIKKMVIQEDPNDISTVHVNMSILTNSSSEIGVEVL